MNKYLTISSCVQEDAPLSGQDIPTDTEFLVRSPEVTSVIRKQLAPAIRDLMHHGLGQVATITHQSILLLAIIFFILLLLHAAGCRHQDATD